jgi:cysteine desulfurase
MLPFLREHFGNPSSSHGYGRAALEAVHTAREQVAGLLGCDVDEVVFTSGGTESNNLAIRGVAAGFADRRHILTTVIEHPATTNPCRHLEGEGWRVTWIPVDETGKARVNEAVHSLSGDTALVTVMHANNEVGTIQPIEEISRAARSAGALVHTDAAQSVGKVPTAVDELGVDLLSVAGHKLYAPKGVGALYVRRGTPVHPLLLGAGHERGLRPGTENVASIVGLGRACEIALQDLDAEAARVRALRDQLFERLRAEIPGIELNGHLTARLPNTLNVRFPDRRGSAVLASATEIAAATGSACHEGGEAPSAVLTAMGISAERALGAVRLSLGRSTTAEQVSRAAAALIRAWRAR